MSARRNIPAFVTQEILNKIGPIIGDGVHDTDLMLWYTGANITSAYAQTVDVRGLKYPDLGWTMCRFDSGAVGVLENVWCLPGQTPFQIDERMEMRVVRPGRIIDIKADLAAGRATVEKIEPNLWGIMNALHQFNGVRMDDPNQKRDWFATTLWTLSMDALCVGLIVLVLSSLYMWYRLDTKRRLGSMALGAGILCCGFFVFGLTWIE